MRHLAGLVIDSPVLARKGKVAGAECATLLGCSRAAERLCVHGLKLERKRPFMDWPTETQCGSGIGVASRWRRSERFHLTCCGSQLLFVRNWVGAIILGLARYAMAMLWGWRRAGDVWFAWAAKGIFLEYLALSDEDSTRIPLWIVAGAAASVAVLLLVLLFVGSYR